MLKYCGFSGVRSGSVDSLAPSRIPARILAFRSLHWARSGIALLNCSSSAFASAGELEPGPAAAELEAERLILELGLVEVLLTPQSRLIGRTVRESGVRRRFGVNVVAVRRRGQVLDRPVVVAYLMVVVLMFVVINLIVDIIYSILDPRVRLQDQGA